VVVHSTYSGVVIFKDIEGRIHSRRKQIKIFEGKIIKLWNIVFMIIDEVEGVNRKIIVEGEPEMIILVKSETEGQRFNERLNTKTELINNIHDVLS
jgi:hypothetical protein